MEHGLLAVFIEWEQDGHEKFEYIGLYTNDSSELFMRDIKKVAEHLKIEKYESYAVLSHPNIPTIMFEDEEESVMQQRVENFKKDVDTFADKLERFKNFSQTEEDAKAILKDAEKI